jgi:di/tricarboxylate transporter
MFISNAATAVIVAPIAITTSLEMGISPLPVAMTVAIACSAAFLTPLSSPVNMLVAAPGNYSLRDFLFTGLPLLMLIAAVSIGLIPFLFPF